MEAKEKAEELIKKFEKEILRGKYHIDGFVVKELSEECALIAVEEIMCSNPHSNPFNTDVYSTMEFWQEVKRELENL